MVYPVPENLGQDTQNLAFSLANPNERISTDINVRQKFQKDIENTWLFAAGTDFMPDWLTNKGRMNFVGIFEENVRFQFSNRGGDVSNVYSTVGRFTINVSKENQTLRDLINDFDFRIKNIDPKNIVTIVGQEYLKYEDEFDSYYNFEKDLTEFLGKILPLRENTSTVCIVKRWKLPNPQNDANINNLNQRIEKLNNVVNKVIYNICLKDANAAKRITIADMTNSFLKNESSGNGWLDSNNALTPYGNSLLGKTILQSYAPSEDRWVDFINDDRINHNNVKPLGFSYTNLKNHLDIKSVSVSTPINNNGANVVDIEASIPNVKNGTKLRYLIERDELGFKQTDVVSINDSKLVISDVVFNDTNKLNKITNKNFTNDFKLTIFDENNNPYNKYYGNLSNVKKQPKTLSKAQKKFIDKFNDKSKPIVWDFLGDSIEHGALHNLGYDTYPNVVQKSVLYDWGREDDIFINAAMTGDFTNRATDDYLIQSRISKYKPDVVSINLGITDGIDGVWNGQVTKTDKQQYQANFKKIVESCKKANPDVVIVVSAIHPTLANDRKDVPGKYNPYLEELFGDSVNGPYSDYVIYNSEIYDILNQTLTNYPYLYTSNLFMSWDAVHPGACVNIIKAKSFLKALGLNPDDSYLGSFQLSQRVPYEGEDDNKISQINILKSNDSKNIIIPDLTSWINVDNPIMGPVKEKGIGQTFLTLTSDTNKNFHQFIMTNFDVKENIYNFGYTPTGSYSLSSWSTTKTEISNDIKYYCKTPISNIKVGG